MKDLRYAMNLVWSREDGGYIATIPELRGVSAFGETVEDAVREMGRVARSVVEAMRESGELIPAPWEMPTYSGQFRVRIPASMHESLATRARHEGVSLNTLIVGVLAEGLGVRGDSILGGNRQSSPDQARRAEALRPSPPPSPGTRAAPR